MVSTAIAADEAVVRASSSEERDAAEGKGARGVLNDEDVSPSSSLLDLLLALSASEKREALALESIFCADNNKHDNDDAHAPEEDRREAGGSGERLEIEQQRRRRHRLEFVDVGAVDKEERSAVARIPFGDF